MPFFIVIVINKLGILGAVLITTLFLSSNFAYAQLQYADEVVDQLSEGAEQGISSIVIPDDNLIDTNQEEVDDLAKSFSEWLSSFYDFGKKTHAVTEDAMSVAAPSWVDQIIISIVAGAVVVFIMWRVAKKVGIHVVIGMGFLAAVIVFLMLLDINS